MFWKNRHKKRDNEKHHEFETTIPTVETYDRRGFEYTPEYFEQLKELQPKTDWKKLAEQIDNLLKKQKTR